MSERCMEADVVVLGGGLTGLSAAWHLRGKDCLLLEKENRIGGLARTDCVDGFCFDFGSHIWFSGDSSVEAFVQSLPGVDMRQHQRSAWVHLYGRRVPAPIQANLHGLPLHVVSDCLAGYIDVVKDQDKRIESFADWMRASFGEGIYKHFLLPYNTKVWTVPPGELTTDWQGSRVDIPDARELIDGAIGLRVNSMGLNAQFGYPANGGIEAVAAAIASECEAALCGTCVTAIDPCNKVVTLADGRRVRYGRLISTIPLPSLVGVLPHSRLGDSAGLLRSTQLLLVNIALRSRPEQDCHWIYFAEPEYPFFRVSFLHNYSDVMCPEGAGAIQAECAFPASAEVDSARVSDLAVDRLAEAGYLDRSSVLFARTRNVSPAYVLYDHNRREALKKLLPNLVEQDIYCCGRFGAWEYLNMDGCIIAGRDAAKWARS